MKAILRYLDDHINPVLLKELRQSFHNKRMLLTMATLLAAQLIVLLFFQKSALEKGTGFPTGSAMMSVQMFILALSGLVLCVGSSYNRYLTERTNRELDYSLLSVLTPHQILQGKIAAAIVLLAFIYALCLPFMTIAYFLRGISLPLVGMMVLQLAVPLIVLTQFALLIASSGKRWMGSIALVVIGIFCIQNVLMGSLMFFRISPHKGWAFLSIGLFGYLLLSGLFYVLTLAVISPPDSNRILPVRIYLFCMAAGIMPAVVFAQHLEGKLSATSLCGSAALALFLLVTALAVITLLEREKPGPRVLLRCPTGRAGRWLHFLFSSGCYGGLALTWLVLGLTTVWLVLLHSRHPADRTIFVCALTGTIGAYILFYAECALLLRRFVGKLSSIQWGLIVFIILGGLPIFCCFDSLNQPKMFSGLITSPWFLTSFLTTKSTMSLPPQTLNMAILSGYLFAVPGALALVPQVLRAFREHRRPVMDKEE